MRKRPSSFELISAAILPAFLFFISTTNNLYLRNQHEFQNQLSLYLPFVLVFILTSVLAYWILKNFERGNIFAFLAWPYLLSLFFILIYTNVVEMRGIERRDLIFVLTTITYGFFVWLMIRSHYQIKRICEFFALLAPLLIIYEGYIFYARYQNYQPSKVKPIVAPHERSVGKNNPNIYHILLDAYESQVFEQDLDTYRDLFAGFTFYPLNRALYDWTIMSLPSVFSGRLYRPDRETQPGYAFKSFNTEESLLSQLRSQGYTIVTFTRRLFPFRMTNVDHDFLHTENVNAGVAINRRSAFVNVWLFKYLPPLIYNPFSYLGLFMDVSLMAGLDTNDQNPPFVPAEEALSAQRISEEEANYFAPNRYTFIHLTIPHNPFVLDEDCKPLPRGKRRTSFEAQSKCSIKLVQGILNTIKAKGRFKDSAIIVHGDHGQGFMKVPNAPKGGRIEMRSPYTLLLYKPFGVDAAQPLKIDRRHSNLMDIAPTILDGLGRARPSTYVGESLLGPSPRKEPYGYYYKGEKVGGMMRFIYADQPQVDRPELIFDQTVAITAKQDDSIENDYEVKKVFLPENIYEIEDSQPEGMIEILSPTSNSNGPVGMILRGKYKFKIDEPGTYNFQVRTYAPTGDRNSFYIIADDGERRAWDIELNRNFTWQKYRHLFKLSPGEFEVILERRETTLVDQFRLVKVK